MKLSIFDPASAVQYIKVYFNGERQKYVQALDTKEGWIDAYVVNEEGLIERQPDLAPAIKRKYGKVEVRLEDE